MSTHSNPVQDTASDHNSLQESDSIEIFSDHDNENSQPLFHSEDASDSRSSSSSNSSLTEALRRSHAAEPPLLQARRTSSVHGANHSNSSALLVSPSLHSPSSNKGEEASQAPQSAHQADTQQPVVGDAISTESSPLREPQHHHGDVSQNSFSPVAEAEAILSDHEQEKALHSSFSQSSSAVLPVHEAVMVEAPTRGMSGSHSSCLATAVEGPDTAQSDAPDDNAVVRSEEKEDNNAAGNPMPPFTIGSGDPDVEEVVSVDMGEEWCHSSAHVESVVKRAASEEKQQSGDEESAPAIMNSVDASPASAADLPTLRTLTYSAASSDDEKEEEEAEAEATTRDDAYSATQQMSEDLPRGGSAAVSVDETHIEQKVTIASPCLGSGIEVSQQAVSVTNKVDEEDDDDRECDSPIQENDNRSKELKRQWIIGAIPSAVQDERMARSYLESKEEELFVLMSRMHHCMISAFNRHHIIAHEAAARATIISSFRGSGHSLYHEQTCTRIDDDIRLIRDSVHQRALLIESEGYARRSVLPELEAREREELRRMHLIGMAGLIRQADALRLQLSVRAKEALEDLVYAEKTRREGVRVDEVRTRALLYEHVAGSMQRSGAQGRRTGVMQDEASSVTISFSRSIDEGCSKRQTYHTDSNELAAIVEQEFFEWDPTHNTSSGKHTTATTGSASSPSPQQHSSMLMLSSSTDPHSSSSQHKKMQQLKAKRHTHKQKGYDEEEEEERSPTVLIDATGAAARANVLLHALKQTKGHGRGGGQPRNPTPLRSHSSSGIASHHRRQKGSNTAAARGEASVGLPPRSPRTQVSSSPQKPIVNRHLVPCSLKPPSSPSSPSKRIRIRPLSEVRNYDEEVVFAVDPNYLHPVHDDDDEDGWSTEEVSGSPISCVSRERQQVSEVHAITARDGAEDEIEECIPNDCDDNIDNCSASGTQRPPASFEMHCDEDYTRRDLFNTSGVSSQNNTPSRQGQGRVIVDVVTPPSARSNIDIVVSPMTVGTSPSRTYNRSHSSNRRAGYMAPTAASMRQQQETAFARLLLHGHQRQEKTPSRSRSQVHCSSSRRRRYGSPPDQPQSPVLISRLPMESGPGVWSSLHQPRDPYGDAHIRGRTGAHSDPVHVKATTQQRHARASLLRHATPPPTNSELRAAIDMAAQTDSVVYLPSSMQHTLQMPHHARLPTPSRPAAPRSTTASLNSSATAAGGPIRYSYVDAFYREKSSGTLRDKCEAIRAIDAVRPPLRELMDTCEFSEDDAEDGGYDDGNAMLCRPADGFYSCIPSAASSSFYRGGVSQAPRSGMSTMNASSRSVRRSLLYQ